MHLLANNASQKQKRNILHNFFYMPVTWNNKKSIETVGKYFNLCKSCWKVFATFAKQFNNHRSGWLIHSLVAYAWGKLVPLADKQATNPIYIQHSSKNGFVCALHSLCRRLPVGDESVIHLQGDIYDFRCKKPSTSKKAPRAALAHCQ